MLRFYCDVKMYHIYEHGNKKTSLDCGEHSAPVSSEDNTGGKIDKGDINLETSSPYTVLNNCPLKKNPMTEPGIELAILSLREAAG